MAYVPLGIKDRVPTNPGQVQLVPVVGQTNVYTMTMADSPTQTGNIINAAIFAAIDTEFILLDMLMVQSQVQFYKNGGGGL
jgi:hypothetical protein